jgi:hypothetical protein
MEDQSYLFRREGYSNRGHKPKKCPRLEYRLIYSVALKLHDKRTEPGRKLFVSALGCHNSEKLSGIRVLAGIFSVLWEIMTVQQM